MHRGARLLVFSFDPYRRPSECRVLEIAVDRLICDGGRHKGAVEYPRNTIATLQKRPHEPIAGLLLKSGLISAAMGLGCGVDGGPVCLTPEVIALALLTAGLVALIVEGVHDFHARHALPLYEAPYLPPAPQAPPS